MFLISHFYNEEFLLPFWIKHHLPMFDHAVLIDYGSTDNSVDIIKELAPDWEVRQSRNKYFVEPYIGNEVMEIEEEFEGWKIALNITEFLFHHDIRYYCNRLEEEGRNGILTNGVIMVDTPEDRSVCDPDKPLVLQKTNGYFEVDVKVKPSTTGMKSCSRSRLLHKHPNGAYSHGRHKNYWTKKVDWGLYLCWFGWAPFDYVKNRKLQIQHKVDEKQKLLKDWAAIYCIDEDRIEDMYNQEHVRSYNLLRDNRYRNYYEIFERMHSSSA